MYSSELNCFLRAQNDITKLRSDMTGIASPALEQLRQYREKQAHATSRFDYSANLTYQQSLHSDVCIPVPNLGARSLYGQSDAAFGHSICAPAGSPLFNVQQRLQYMTAEEKQLEDSINDLKAQLEDVTLARSKLGDVAKIIDVVVSNTSSKSATALRTMSYKSTSGSLVATIASSAVAGGSKTPAHLPEIIALAQAISNHSSSSYDAIKAAISEMPSARTIAEHNNAGGSTAAGVTSVNFTDLQAAASAHGVDITKSGLVLHFDEVNCKESGDINLRTGLIDGIRTDTSLLGAYSTADRNRLDDVNDPDYVGCASALGNGIHQMYLSTHDRKFHYPLGFYVTR